MITENRPISRWRSKPYVKNLKNLSRYPLVICHIILNKTIPLNYYRSTGQWHPKSYVLNTFKWSCFVLENNTNEQPISTSELTFTLFFGHTWRPAGSSASRDWARPLRWEPRVLTTRPPGKPPLSLLIKKPISQTLTPTKKISPCQTIKWYPIKYVIIDDIIFGLGQILLKAKMNFMNFTLLKRTCFERFMKDNTWQGWCFSFLSNT